MSKNRHSITKGSPIGLLAAVSEKGPPPPHPPKPQKKPVAAPIPAAKTKPKLPPPGSTKHSEDPPDDHLPQPVCLKLTGQAAASVASSPSSSTLARLVCGLERTAGKPQQQLPTVIRVTKNFGKKGSPGFVKASELLLLCFVVEVPTVQATYDDGHDVIHLPVAGNQRYIRLPENPLLDDIVYNGTTALIEAKPMPKEVRVLEAVFVDEPDADQEVNDIIIINGIELRYHPKRGEERVLMGREQRGKYIKYPEDPMDQSTYTSMLYPEPTLLSEVVNQKLPQRVRLHHEYKESEGSKKQKTPSKTKHESLKLLRHFTEYHVIAARATAASAKTTTVKDDTLLSIPIHTNLDFEVVDDASIADIKHLLPSVFSRTNATWLVSNITQPALTDEQKPVTRPLEGPLEEWLKSHTGRVWILNRYENTTNTMLDELHGLQTEVASLRKGLSCLNPPPKPDVPGREKKGLEASTPPPLPPREPVNVTNSAMHAKTNTQANNTSDSIDDLKKLIYKKDEEIFQLRSENRKQKELYEGVCKERAELQRTRDSDQKEILKLQMEIDVLYKNGDGGLYEDINELNPTDMYYSSAHVPNPQTKGPGSTDTYYSSAHVPNPRTKGPGSTDTYYASAHGPNPQTKKPGSTDTHYASAHGPNPQTKGPVLKDVSEFLTAVGLPQYCDVFTKEHIDKEMLVNIDEEIMVEDLGMRKLDARKLATKLNQLPT